ncbi:MAG: alkyl hydroperoxide reductase [Actinobacteria bacterium]|nr:MAG: alkyl hydroperoxide reductase [Actinomycetota bacterium]
MHMLPRVRELEGRHADSLVTIGVHSGKFIAERSTGNIRAACARLGVDHPVLNDRYFRQWRSYSVQAWPTIALIDPEGYVLFTQAGEFDLEEVDRGLVELIERYDREGKLQRGAIDFGDDPKALAEPAGMLRFPTRVAVEDRTMYVADSGNRRVLELELVASPMESAEPRAELRRVFGTGEDGMLDGAPDEAQFSEPQGIVIDGKHVYVADRSNHAIRRLDRETGDVSTVAGTGSLAEGRIGAGPALETDLRSPWGLAQYMQYVYVAMAGSHQIWKLHLDGNDMGLHAGSGIEAIGDGPQLRAALAQPTGLAIGDEILYFACSENSAVRYTDILPNRDVRTIVGTGLFDFGDRDGMGDEVLLQHDQDLAWHRKKLLVADTYNDKIKVVDPATKRSMSVASEAGEGGYLNEPSGIWADDRMILVADTNNHRIVSLNPETGMPAELALE